MDVCEIRSVQRMSRASGLIVWRGILERRRVLVVYFCSFCRNIMILVSKATYWGKKKKTVNI